ncbi:hypothetical protein ACK8P5_24950 [Paenibacillus sp. EC2-1]|uniref:hypothetical protein n=1 Tax=Paenibacillus sp. EC2-1 TaxID=3388665 RepID=UPI003BEF2F82
MKRKKTVVGILSAFMVVGASASAFAASEGTGNTLDQISAKVSTFVVGTSDKNYEGKEQLKKEILEDNNLSVEMKVLEPGTMHNNMDGKEMLTKKIIEE